MTKQTTMNLQQLQGIAEKITGIERPKDFKNCPIEFTKEEQGLLDALKPIVEYLAYDELFRLNQKVLNHHHVVLSPRQSMEFKDRLYQEKHGQDALKR
jgi:hypothetical protein